MDFRCLSLKLLGNYLVLSTIWVGPWQNVKQEKLAFGCSAIILGKYSLFVMFWKPTCKDLVPLSPHSIFWLQPCFPHTFVLSKVAFRR